MYKSQVKKGPVLSNGGLFCNVRSFDFALTGFAQDDTSDYRLINPSVSLDMAS